MTNEQIIRVLREAAIGLQHDFNPEDLRMVGFNERSYSVEDFAELKRDIIEAGRKVRLLILEYRLPLSQFSAFTKESSEPILVFGTENDQVSPILLQKRKGVVYKLLVSGTEEKYQYDVDDAWFKNEQGEIISFVILPYKSVVSDYQHDGPTESVTPVKRLFRLLSTERKDIVYILLYALFIGLVSLILPLGLQTTVELISGGVFFSSVYILIGLVILGVLITGGLQVVQISLVEHLQRRIFTKAAFEFAYRIPRIKAEALMKNYAPELVNRFFDVITIQKGLPKLLIDFSSGAIQILFGLLLLSLYHPFFVFFGLSLLLVLAIIFIITGPRGLDSSIGESKYKYKVVQWLEELARTMNSFKLAGNTDLPIQKTDYSVSNYLKYRKTHFGVLLKQYSFFVFFKVAVTGGLLIMGTILVINREITLGQFVASEVIIILVLNAVEKIIMYIDVVYDLLTAVDKVSHVTDLPLEKIGGVDFPKRYAAPGYGITTTKLQYTYEDQAAPALKDINLVIQPGERICIAGPGGSGKTTLTNIIAGLYGSYEGGVSINNFSLRDLDITHLRDKVAKNISQDDIFDGTIYENITVGKTTTRIEDVIVALERVGLKEWMTTLPEGLNTHIVSGGKGLSSSIIHRLILGRCLAKKPALIVLNDFFSGLTKSDKLQLVRSVINPDCSWTLLAVSNDPLVMASCDRVIVLDEGRIVADDTYNSLAKQGLINQYFE